eukprot:TRINITY_DN65_c0_g1_i2.p1 TRINITY_DN65_c0_g1~~TRINITY_DN65_c0_g1_i2.p1  ORF type:complete len:1375 (+),score=296.60 TRINITY_DN65_c0_g1_i2:232-4356(+)
MNTAAHHSLLLGEVQYIMTIMRQNKRFQQSYLLSHQLRSSEGLLRAFQDLRASLNPVLGLHDDFDRLKLVAPFIAIIRAEEISGLITGESLNALYKFLKHGFFTLKACNGIAAVGEIVESISHCRFEATDTGKDEIVLNKILSVQLACLSSECGSYLSDHAVWEMFQTSLRIYHQMKPPDYSDLLSDSAQFTLTELVRLVFGRLSPRNVSFSPEEIVNNAELFHESNREFRNQFFGIPCMVKLFSSLCLWAARGIDNLDEEFFDSSSNLSVSSISNISSPGSVAISPLNTLILRLILAALDEAGFCFPGVPALLTLVKDDVCSLLLRCSRSTNAETLNLILRIFYNVVIICRQELKMQIEVIINSIYMRLVVPGTGPKFGDHSKASVRLANEALPHAPSESDLQSGRRISFSRPIENLGSELTITLLDGLVALCQIPWFCREIYANYDCDPRCTNVFHNLIRVACQYAFPVNGSVTGVHFVALDVLRWMIINLDSEIPQESKGDSNSVVEQLLTSRHQKEILSEAIELFNQKPGKGVQKLLMIPFLNEDDHPKKIAELLRFTFGFSKTKIGEFIGGGDALAAQVRKNFMELFDFRNRSIDEALRMSFEAFRLPKEAQEIDRILQAFSLHFYEQNASMFANADAVHLLTFSLLMLHTDAWSKKVKNKMSLEEWFRIHRDVNSGEGLPHEYLERLYNSVTRNEFKVSEAGLGGVVTDSLWSDLLARSYSQWGRQYIEIGASVLDNHMFSELWSPALAAFLVIFNSATDARLLSSITDAFVSMAKLSARQNLSTVMDELVICLFQVSGLSNVETPDEDLVYEFGNSLRFQFATKLLVEFLGNFSAYIRTSWSSILLMFFNLLRINVLPTSAYMLDDFLDGSQFPLRALSFTVQKPVSNAGIQSFFGVVTSLLVGPSEPKSADSENKHSPDALAQALLSTREFLSTLGCSPHILLSESKFLSDTSLAVLFDCLLSPFGNNPGLLQDEKVSSSFGSRILLPASLHSKQQVFYLQLMIDILTNNSDRVEKFFNKVFGLCSDIMRAHSSGSHSRFENSDFVLEGAIVSFFKLSVKFGEKKSLRPLILSIMSEVCSINVFSGCPPRTCLQFLQGLFSFIEANLHQLEHFGLMPQIISICRKTIQISFTHTSTIALLDYLVKSAPVTPWLTHIEVDPFFELLLQTLVFSTNLNQSFEIVLSWFKIMISSLPNLEEFYKLKIGNADFEVVDEKLWKQIRFPIFQNLGSLCITNSAFIREQSLDLLHTSLLLLDGDQLGQATIRGVFEDVVLVIAHELSDDKLSAESFSKSRLLISKLFCKLFLTHISRLLKMQKHFHELWSSVLDCISKFALMESNPSSLLVRCFAFDFHFSFIACRTSHFKNR